MTTTFQCLDENGFRIWGPSRVTKVFQIKIVMNRDTIKIGGSRTFMGDYPTLERLGERRNNPNYGYTDRRKPNMNSARRVPSLPSVQIKSLPLPKLGLPQPWLNRGKTLYLKYETGGYWLWPLSRSDGAFSMKPFILFKVPGKSDSSIFCGYFSFIQGIWPLEAEVNLTEFSWKNLKRTDSSDIQLEASFSRPNGPAKV